MSIGSRPIGLLPIAADEPVASTPGAYSIVASAGSYVLTGTAAGLKHGWVVAAAPGAYAMTGAAAALKHGYKVPATAGSYALTGSAAALKHGWKVPAGVGSYALAGSVAGLALGRKVAAAAGSYAMSGAAAALKHGWVTAAAPGSYAFLGSDAALSKLSSKFVLAGSGIYLMTGSDAALVYTPAAAGAGSAPYGYGGSVHRQGDTRWDGVREAREEARALFDEVAATTPAKRKDAAVRASEAVAKVARTIQPVTQLPQLGDGLASLLEDLDQLQAFLSGLADQDRIRAAQARDAAARWAMIERDLAIEAAQEEELMVVLAMAL